MTEVYLLTWINFLIKSYENSAIKQGASCWYVALQIQQLETQVLEAEQNACEANQQVIILNVIFIIIII